MINMYIKRLVSFGTAIVFIVFILIVNIPHKVAKAYDNLYYGIDVSSNQGTINWNSVKNAGISFAIIRSGFRMLIYSIVRYLLYISNAIEI